MSRIPDRWTNYTPMGQRIPGTRFVAFKVPLGKGANKTVEKKLRLDIGGLLRSLPELGLIIDLTNTKRYYDPEDIKSAGVEHRKLMVPGHVTPPKHCVKIFKLYVLDFLRANQDNDTLIGVHCTHGVNRTGFMICNYMISMMNIAPDDAIQRFAAARGHKIERTNYLNALHVLIQDDRQHNDDNGQVQELRIDARRYQNDNNGQVQERRIDARWYQNDDNSQGQGRRIEARWYQNDDNGQGQVRSIDARRYQTADNGQGQGRRIDARRYQYDDNGRGQGRRIDARRHRNYDNGHRQGRSERFNPYSAVPGPLQNHRNDNDSEHTPFVCRPLRDPRVPYLIPPRGSRQADDKVNYNRQRASADYNSYAHLADHT